MHIVFKKLLHQNKDKSEAENLESGGKAFGIGIISLRVEYLYRHLHIMSLLWLLRWKIDFWDGSEIASSSSG